MKALIPISILLVAVGCSPITSNQHDEKYKWELTIHEVQTNLDDLRHDTHVMLSEMRILDGRIKAFEAEVERLKFHDMQQQLVKVDQLCNQFYALEKKYSSFEKKVNSGQEAVESLASFAKETSFALSQFKNKIQELEEEIVDQTRKLESISKLKSHIEALSKSLAIDTSKVHKVKSGETLEKIAKMYKTDVAAVKQLNQLSNDLIVVDQELKIP